MTNAPSKPLNEIGIKPLLDSEIEQVNGGVNPFVWAVWQQHMRYCYHATVREQSK